jgi:hypothetical protein
MYSLKTSSCRIALASLALSTIALVGCKDSTGVPSPTPVESRPAGAAPAAPAGENFRSLTNENSTTNPRPQGEAPAAGGETPPAGGAGSGSGG